MSEKKEGKDANKKAEWKPNPNLTMEIKKGDDWKPTERLTERLTMKLKEAKEKE